MIRPITVEIKSRGQLTIPKKIRAATCLEEDRVVSIIRLGDSLLIIPQRLTFEDARVKNRQEAGEGRTSRNKSGKRS